MRRFVFLFLSSITFAAPPPELGLALKNFRADPPPGWSFTQTTAAAGESMVERCDAAKPLFARWSLVQKNGRASTSDERRDYDDGRSRWSRRGTAPKLTDQLDLGTVETVREDATRATFRCRLRRGEEGDTTSPHLRATIIVDKATHAIATLALARTEPFSPAFGVKIAKMTTTMSYRAPSGDTPALPHDVTTHVRGRAFFLKSLDADMTVTFSDYERATKR